MTIRERWKAFRDANLAAFQVRHRSSRFAGTDRVNQQYGVPPSQ